VVKMHSDGTLLCRSRNRACYTCRSPAVTIWNCAERRVYRACAEPDKLPLVDAEGNPHSSKAAETASSSVQDLFFCLEVSGVWQQRSDDN
jgi:hypothetical protein